MRPGSDPGEETMEQQRNAHGTAVVGQWVISEEQEQAFPLRDLDAGPQSLLDDGEALWQKLEQVLTQPEASPPTCWCDRTPTSTAHLVPLHALTRPACCGTQCHRKPLWRRRFCAFYSARMAVPNRACGRNFLDWTYPHSMGIGRSGGRRRILKQSKPWTPHLEHAACHLPELVFR